MSSSRHWKPGDRDDGPIAVALKQCTEALQKLSEPNRLRVLAGLRAWATTSDGFVEGAIAAPKERPSRRMPGAE